MLAPLTSTHVRDLPGSSLSLMLAEIASRSRTWLDVIQDRFERVICFTETPRPETQMVLDAHLRRRQQLDACLRLTTRSETCNTCRFDMIMGSAVGARVLKCGRRYTGRMNVVVHIRGSFFRRALRFLAA